jgi:poly(3-hydroxybutyrate) depolymerase
LSVRRAGGVLAALLPLLVSASSVPSSRFAQEVLPGTAVRYTVAVPQGLGATDGAPLVVSLHYGGPVSPWYGRGLLEAVVEPALRPLGAVMVAPDCPLPAWVECEQALDDVVAQVQARYHTAEGCVVLTGYSKGGIGAWVLAGRAPARYSAVVVMAGRAPDEALRQRWRVPVRVIHGAADELFPADEAAAAVAWLRKAGVDADIQLLDGVSHYETHRFTAALAGQADWLRAHCRR